MEAVLQLHGVAASFDGSAPIFSNVNVRLTRGLIGLVGANGSGKTTLLRLLSGELTPNDGHVERLPSAARVAVCPQHTGLLTDSVRVFGQRPSSLSSRLELDSFELERWETLSPGEKKRWQIGAALHEEPDILLIDEPTNHLDAHATRLLRRALASHPGLGVIVSHDRRLLDELTNRTLRIHQGKVALYPGNYEEACVLWERERQTAEAKHAASREAVAKASRKLEAASREREERERGRSTRHRMKGKRDHDAKSMAAKNLADKAEARASRSVALSREALVRATRDVVPFERDRTRGRSLRISFTRPASTILFHLDRADLVAGTHVVAKDVSLTIGRDERVRISGMNGAGKSTLLSALLQSHRGAPSHVLYMAQELGAADVRELLTRVRDLEPEARGRVFSLFASLGSDPARVVDRTVDLSPGEARKLALSFGLGRGSSALVLDEPTNHLDLATIERLERALTAYNGCVVLVSHDEEFAARTTTRTYTIEGGRLR